MEAKAAVALFLALVPLKDDSRNILIIQKEVPFKQNKWPCPYANEIPLWGPTAFPVCIQFPLIGIIVLIECTCSYREGRAQSQKINKGCSQEGAERCL